MEKWQEWYNSPYAWNYYSHKDEVEAKLFLGNLQKKLNFNKYHNILDLGCGIGRHSKYLNEQDCNVTGIDKSEYAISQAQKHNKPNLNFICGDISKVIKVNSFDFIFSIFTSFGYQSLEVSYDILRAINMQLKSEGLFILDMKNNEYITPHISKPNKKIINNITYITQRNVNLTHCIKKIKCITQDNIIYDYEEKINIFRLSDYEELFKKSQFKIKSIYGDYHLNEYNKHFSDRIIFLLKKNNR